MSTLIQGLEAILPVFWSCLESFGTWLTTNTLGIVILAIIIIGVICSIIQTIFGVFE